MRAEVVRRDAPDDDDGRGIWRKTCSGCGQRKPGHPGSRCPGKLVIISDPPQDLLAGCRQVDCDHQRQRVADLLARGVPLASGDARPAPCQVADLLARGVPPAAGDLRAGRDAPPVHSVLPAYAADLVADGASLSYTRTAYGGAKAALASASRTWALELAEFGITVNTIAPGPVDTEFFRQNNPEDSKIRQEKLDRIPLGRFANPSDIANMAAFLLSSEANYITGQMFHVDGGSSIASAPLF